jgi:hypothetical protein
MQYQYSIHLPTKISFVHNLSFATRYIIQNVLCVIAAPHKMKSHVMLFEFGCVVSSFCCNCPANSQIKQDLSQLAAQYFICTLVNPLFTELSCILFLFIELSCILFHFMFPLGKGVVLSLYTFHFLVLQTSNFHECNFQQLQEQWVICPKALK